MGINGSKPSERYLSVEANMKCEFMDVGSLKFIKKVLFVGDLALRDFGRICTGGSIFARTFKRR